MRMRLSEAQFPFAEAIVRQALAYTRVAAPVATERKLNYNF